VTRSHAAAQKSGIQATRSGPDEPTLGEQSLPTTARLMCTPGLARVARGAVYDTYCPLTECAHNLAAELDALEELKPTD
jgi:hypothetical protein